MDGRTKGHRYRATPGIGERMKFLVTIAPKKPEGDGPTDWSVYVVKPDGCTKSLLGDGHGRDERDAKNQANSVIECYKREGKIRNRRYTYEVDASGRRSESPQEES